MLKNILIAIVFFIGSLFLAEFVMRLMGFRPHSNRDYSFRSVPRDCYIPDSLLASRLGEGSFKGIVNEKLTYSTNHVLTGYTVTRKIYDVPVDSALPRIDFHGCSFTYGMGVNDTEVYPYLFAVSHKDYQVRNYGCPGYATLEALIILKRQLIQNDLPQVVVVNYLDFHEERNTGTAEWRSGLKEGFLLGSGRCLSEKIQASVYTSHFPFSKLVNDKLRVNWFDINNLYYPFFGRNISVLIYLLEKAVNRLLYNEPNQSAVTKAIFLEIRKICDKNKLHLIVTTMSAGKKTRDIQNFLTENHFNWVDISVDFFNPAYTNYPYDGHPSPLAHRCFAEKLANIEMRM